MSNENNENMLRGIVEWGVEEWRWAFAHASIIESRLRLILAQQPQGEAMIEAQHEGAKVGREVGYAQWYADAKAALQAAPVAQELTNEQILDAWRSFGSLRPYMLTDEVISFARTILATAGSNHVEDARQMVASGWTEDSDANAALLMLDRLDVSGEDDARVDAIAATIRRLAAPSASAQQAAPVAVELRAVAETVAEGGGFWTPCTGCYDTEDGRPTQKYAHSDVFGCELGNGCRECGGLGAVWDDTDYAAMAEFMEQQDTAPAPSASPAALTDEQIIEAIAQMWGWFNWHAGAWKVQRAEVVEFVRGILEERLAASPADQVEDARDAARYRWWREWLFVEHTINTGMELSGVKDGKDLDARIDAAMSASKEGA